jgi:hypothetical protein
MVEEALTLDKISQEWKTDCRIDIDHLDREAIYTYQLHQKYSDWLTDVKAELLLNNRDLKTLKGIKGRYFTGELSREELSKHGYKDFHPYKVLRGDLDKKIEQDPDVIEKTSQLEYLQLLEDKLLSILLAIRDRTWGIGRSIEFQKFKAGF